MLRYYNSLDSLQLFLAQTKLNENLADYNLQGEKLKNQFGGSIRSTSVETTKIYDRSAGLKRFYKLEFSLRGIVPKHPSLKRPN